MTEQKTDEAKSASGAAQALTPDLSNISLPSDLLGKSIAVKPEVSRPDDLMCELLLTEGTSIRVFGDYKQIWASVLEQRKHKDGAVDVTMPFTEDTFRHGSMLADSLIGCFEAGTHGEFWDKRHKQLEQQKSMSALFGR